MLQGLNHLTLAVSDLAASMRFYHGLLGLEIQAHWENGAYLSCGSLWLCLSVDAARRPVAPENSDYTHYAFTIAEQDFTPFTARLCAAGVAIWKENRSEGESFYFLDPDGHKLEIHVGSLAQRLAACRQSPYAGMVFKDEP
ncbi:FosA family fosfomycin resistance glutathione transferase [Chimaeribacter arupi]|uniref:Fosfomycin resistance glutathione transferase n=1 Tax=Chimaeribacter arupi TaxID=2060066 RepID=A0A2N5EIG3_9GAMM|nr:FosA family fosfomycin resistance glutathione transferase [Chimaeribacter arupi]PLR44377.1 fosfomycin resistance glutathione transferase [Chimaeribacter arupi]